MRYHLFLKSFGKVVKLYTSYCVAQNIWPPLYMLDRSDYSKACYKTTPQMTSTESNDGLIITHINDVHKFVCTSETNCQWKREDSYLQIKSDQYKELPNPHRGRYNEIIMMKAPLSLLEKCYCN